VFVVLQVLVGDTSFSIDQIQKPLYGVRFGFVPLPLFSHGEGKSAKDDAVCADAEVGGITGLAGDMLEEMALACLNDRFNLGE